jgi:hypothetical protein
MLMVHAHAQEVISAEALLWLEEDWGPRGASEYSRGNPGTQALGLWTR